MCPDRCVLTLACMQGCMDNHNSYSQKLGWPRLLSPNEHMDCIKYASTQPRLTFCYSPFLFPLVWDGSYGDASCKRHCWTQTSVRSLTTKEWRSCWMVSSVLSSSPERIYRTSQQQRICERRHRREWQSLRDRWEKDKEVEDIFLKVWRQHATLFGLFECWWFNRQ